MRKMKFLFVCIIMGLLLTVIFYAVFEKVLWLIIITSSKEETAKSVGNLFLSIYT